MAFDRERLTSLGGNAKSGIMPRTYSYWNKDGDTVTDAKYFNDIRCNVGDQIWVITADYANQVSHRVSAVSVGKATVVASAA